jgi:hypothetical protein
MAIQNSAQKGSIGFGNPQVYASLSGATAAAATTTNILANVVPAQPLTSPTCRQGHIHLRCTAAGGTGTITSILVTGTDATGTLIEAFYFNGATWAAGSTPNLYIPFWSDASLQTFVANITMAVAAQTTTWDVEIIGTP